MRTFAIKNISSSPLSITTKGINGYKGSVHHLGVGQELELLAFQISPDIEIKLTKKLLTKVERPEIKVISVFSDSASKVEETKTEKPPQQKRGPKKRYNKE